MIQYIQNARFATLCAFYSAGNSPLEIDIIHLLIIYENFNLNILTEDNEVVRVGGVKYTVKDGIVYDAKQLLKDVEKMVEEEKEKSGFKFRQPGEK